jgi:arginine repressor
VTSLLTIEEKELLMKASSLIEELIETLEVSADEELVQDIEDALVEVRQGKTRPIANLLKELGLEGEVQA